MSKSKQVKFVEEVKLGPSGALRYCIICGDVIRDGDHWRRITAPDGSYAVAVHDHCLPLARRNGSERR